MDLKFTVHTISQQSRMQVGEFNGAPLAASVAGTEMELTDPTGVNGSMVLFFSGAEDQAFIEANYKAGDTVTFTLAGTKPTPTKTTAKAATSG